MGITEKSSCSLSLVTRTPLPSRKRSAAKYGFNLAFLLSPVQIVVLYSSVKKSHPPIKAPTQRIVMPQSNLEFIKTPLAIDDRAVQIADQKGRYERTQYAAKR